MGRMFSKNIKNNYKERVNDSYDRYRQIILDATTTQILFPGIHNQGYKPNLPWQSNYFLPSTYQFKSSHQNDDNALTIAHSILNQSMHNMPKLSQHQYPYSCIGLVFGEHQQNNNTYYVYGTGILILEKIVLTSAKNVYCRRLGKEYVNIKFITRIIGNKCSGIYDVMKVHYPNEYLKENYQNYDFAVLQLYYDLSKMYGYVGWKTNYKIQSKETIALGYNKQRSFYLGQLTKYEKLGQNLQICSGSIVLNKEGNQYYLVGLQYLSNGNGIYKILSQLMRRMINEWTKYSRLEIVSQNIGQKCNQIQKYTASDLREMILNRNNIDVQGCKYLSQANWIHLTQIDLRGNNISAQGCKYLSQANWTHLTSIDLSNNFMLLYPRNYINAQGCKYLSQANWKHLTTICLEYNHIGTQGCKYLSQADWKYLTAINLDCNKIDAQGCKYLSQTNWQYLNTINLEKNNICEQGCKYLSQTNFTYLTSISLSKNSINDIIYRLLKQSYPQTRLYI